MVGWGLGEITILPTALSVNLRMGWHERKIKGGIMLQIYTRCPDFRFHNIHPVYFFIGEYIYICGQIFPFCFDIP